MNKDLIQIMSYLECRSQLLANEHERYMMAYDFRPKWVEERQKELETENMLIGRMLNTLRKLNE